MIQSLLRQIPKMDILLSQSRLLKMVQIHGHPYVKEVTETYLNGLRSEVLAHQLETMPTIQEIEQAILEALETTQMYHLRPVINATGVVLHTNLGRAPMGAEMAAHIAQVAQGYCNLEYDIEAAMRGSRYSHVEHLLCKLTGAEAALVVNNNASAVYLMLHTVAKGKGVAVSRGELVEIGGSFRVPDLMAESGAIMVEVGTTNKTHLYDYENAVEHRDVEVLLKVHTSNFIMTGFTEDVSISSLHSLAEEKRLPLLFDLGAGLLFPCEALGLPQGDQVKTALGDGADVVCFSGDKLLGATQCGILVGKKTYIDQMKKNQLTRMMRIDKLSLAGLEFALHHSQDVSSAVRKIPTHKMIAMSATACRERGIALRDMLSKRVPEMEVTLVPTEDQVGGGALPGVLVSGYALSLSLAGLSTQQLEEQLRNQSSPIIARIWKGQLLLSLRTIFPWDMEKIVKACKEIAEVRI